MKRLEAMAIFGDSILKGIQVQKDTKRYCINDELALDSLAEKYGILLENDSHFGYTVERGNRLITKKLEKGLPADFVLLEYGGNDADFKWEEIAGRPLEEHEPNTPLPVFLKTLGSLIDTIRSHGKKPILTTLPPLSAPRYLEWITRNGLSRENILLWLGDEEAIYRYQERYSNGIKTLAERTNTDLIDLRDAFLAHRRILPFLCEDGIHPNGEGQKLIRGVLEKRLPELIMA